MKDFLYWHDPSCKHLLEAFENNWTMEDRLTYDKVPEMCVSRDVQVEVDEALHVMIGAFLDGEARVLAETSEFMDSTGGKTKKSGLELWRLLKANCDRASAFNIISILELIRGMNPAEHINDVLGKMATLDRAHQEYEKQATASKDAYFAKMRDHGIQAYTDVFKKADLLKLLPDGIVEELKTKHESRFRTRQVP